MKRKLLYLTVGQVVSTGLAVMTDASLQNALYLYATQAIVALFVLTWYLLTHTYGGPDNFTIIKAFFTVTFFLAQAGLLAVLFFMLGKLDGSNVVDEGGTIRVLELGKLSVLPLVLSAAAYLVTYAKAAYVEKAQQFKNWLSFHSYNFFLIFAHTAFLVVSISIVLMPIDSRWIIAGIGTLKLVLDIGSVFLLSSLLSADKQMSKLTRKR